VESLLDGGSRVELMVDGGHPDLELGVLFEPLVSLRHSALEVSQEDLSGAEVGCEALADGCGDLVVALGLLGLDGGSLTGVLAPVVPRDSFDRYGHLYPELDEAIAAVDERLAEVRLLRVAG
jgi:hypothetical protein